MAEVRLNLIDVKKSDIKYEKFLFPDGQPHIKFEPYTGERELRVITRISSMNDLMWLVLATQVIDKDFKERHLEISYLMGARMDRKMSDLEPFTLDIVSSIIDACCFDEVSIFDPHSGKTCELIDNSKPISNLLFIKNVLKDINKEHLVLVSPDKGAAEKVDKSAEALGRPALYCQKTRDPKTGKLSNPIASLAGEAENKPLLIVDDICDGGGTFVQLYDELRKQGYLGDIYLAVSHGIFSKGLDPLTPFKGVYTTNSYHQYTPDFNYRGTSFKCINLW